MVGWCKHLQVGKANCALTVSGKGSLRLVCKVFFLGLGFRGSRRVLRKIPIRADCKDYIGGSLRASQGLFKDSLAVLRRGLGLGTAA